MGKGIYTGRVNVETMSPEHEQWRLTKYTVKSQRISGSLEKFKKVFATYSCLS